VYDNGSGRTVVWLPSCTSFTYHFDALKESEKGGEVKETAEIPEGLLESLPWPVAVSLIGDHRVEANMMNRMGSRTGTKDYDSDDNGDKDGDKEDAMEKSLRSEYFWREGHFGENPEDAYIRKETLQEMLDGMTDNQREVFVLYYKCGYTQPEIAAQLCITKQSVNERLRSALERAKRKRDFFLEEP
jgi:RNA polymerase sigma factor (sigma-70 family)